MSVDVQVTNAGVFLFELHTQPAREFVAENVDVADWQWLADDTFAVDGRGYAQGIAQAMLDNGLEVR